MLFFEPREKEKRILHTTAYESLSPEAKAEVDKIVEAVCDKVNHVMEMAFVGAMVVKMFQKFEHEIDEKGLRTNVAVVLEEIYLKIRESLKKHPKK